jgi:hypothetical protein
VLVGAALGNFLAVFSTRAFLHSGSASNARLQVKTLPGGGVVMFSASF